MEILLLCCRPMTSSAYFAKKLRGKRLWNSFSQNPLVSSKLVNPSPAFCVCSFIPCYLTALCHGRYLKVKTGRKDVGLSPWFNPYYVNLIVLLQGELQVHSQAAVLIALRFHLEEHTIILIYKEMSAATDQVAQLASGPGQLISLSQISKVSCLLALKPNTGQEKDKMENYH